MSPKPERAPALLWVGTCIVLAALAVSGIRPYDRLTWWLEVAPVLGVLPVLWLTRNRFPLTPLLLSLVFLHALILILGGAYTYARVPLGFEIARWLDLARNPYDRIGHFFQGLVPALAAREILIRGAYVRRRAMLGFLVVCVALGVSATYELVEWASALLLDAGATEFLGTQGDPWDTQSDMFCALLGASTTLLAFSRVHDRQIDQTPSGSALTLDPGGASQR